ncbi:N-6 DNA methylase [Trichococcus pasteurii]|uniref:site-specific DNA-methyltransferase (adenine-specific) n=1 Tax=Trichococcus pasteurii TaxID=43064 RepID=A0A1W1IJ44_9LACT|nr:N-6 DNA methylase [Trichococcus pasteurii]SFE94474.1 type I restriction enzyme M protein [Trichococcus pasteurii]SLM52763.1 n12 class n6 adenine-specific dna methyltransferase signature [Trichococcus pasteurii]SSB93644.1 n12 class n6 adenine-specific dna methyltransferase signature [Trichococcus pasteurii]
MNKLNTKELLYRLTSELRGKMSMDDLSKLVVVCIFISHDNRRTLSELMQLHKNELYNRLYEKEQETGIELNALGFSGILSTLSTETVLEVYKFLLSIDPQNDSDLVMDMTVSSADFSVTPKSINKLMIALADINEESRILDPAFGIGSTYEEVLERNPGQKIVGQELNPTIYSFALVYLYCLGATGTEVFQGDSISAPRFTNQKFDRVITNAPFGIRATNETWHMVQNDPYNRFRYGLPPKSSLDWAFIMNGLEALEGEGKAVFSVSNSALFMGGQVTKIRENFLAADLIEAVIALPSGLFSPYTQIPTAILVINKNKQRLINKIRMINATSVPIIKTKASVTLAEESLRKIIEAYEGNDDAEGFVKSVDSDEIRKQDSILLPEQYVKDTVYKIDDDMVIEIDAAKWTEADTVKLADIAEIYRGFNAISSDEAADGKYAFIKISDLNNQEVEFSKLAKGNVKENTKVENYQIQKGDILLSARGTTDKFARITEDRAHTLVTQNLVGIRPKKNMVDSRWLLEYLTSPLGLAELASIRVGTTIAQLPMKGLATVKVPKLPLEEQKKMMDAYQGERSLLDKQLSEITMKIQQQKEQLYQEMGITDVYTQRKEEK